MKKHCRGLTLVEILLAIVILGGVLTILGEVARQGFHSAGEARDTTQAELICESLMGMLRAGLIPLETQTEIPLDSDYPDTNAFRAHNTGEERWYYSVDVFATDTEGLLEVAITVRENLPENQRPIMCRLIRWMIDPDFLTQMEEEMDEILNPETTTTEETSTSTSPTTST